MKISLTIISGQRFQHEENPQVSPVPPAAPVGKQIPAVMAGADIRDGYAFTGDSRLFQDPSVGKP